MKTPIKWFITVIIILVMNFTGFAQKSYHTDSIDVLHYNINLYIIDFTNQNISGFTELILKPIYNNLHNIQLDLLSLTIDSVIVNGTKLIVWNYNDTLLNLPLLQPADITDTLIIAVYYYGHPQEDPGINHWGDSNGRGIRHTIWGLVLRLFHIILADAGFRATIILLTELLMIFL